MKAKTLFVFWLTLCMVVFGLVIAIKTMNNGTGENKSGTTTPATGGFLRGAGDYNFLINHNQTIREYFVHVPPSYDKNTPTPVVLNFHGGGGSAEGHMRLTHMNEKSDISGFIAVYPAGTGKYPSLKVGRFWNPGDGPNGPFNSDPLFRDVDDVGFVAALLDDLELKFNIDNKRVYATGLSNGGVFAYTLACRLSDRIAAIAPVAGSFWNYPEDCENARPVSVLHFHGTADACLPYNGGSSGCEQGIAGKGRQFISARESVLAWAKHNNCTLTPSITYRNGDVTCETYANGSENTEVTLCTINGGGHTWPGGEPYTLPGFEIGTVTQDINANEAIWEFFKKHPMP